MLLVGLLTTGSVATAVTAVAMADAPAAGAAGPREGRGPWGKHGGGMAGRLEAHAQELGLSAQQLTAIKAAEDNARPELEKLQQALQARHQALRSQIDGILTADQRTRLQALREQHGPHRFHGMRGQGPHGQAPQGQTPAQK
jgi:hypothetical protein